jgi:hypothetical protein
MLELRITVLRDKPDIDALDKYAVGGYNLFLDTQTRLYFLTDGAVDNFERDGFGSDYHRICNIPFKPDFLSLKALQARHKKRLKDTLIHDEILEDALALSHAFSTRVLCVYSNDESCDFAVTAEQGKLLRLRFKADHEQGDPVNDEQARQIVSEISATRILMDGEEAGEDVVHNFTAWEALQTEATPLTLHPYWHYREGEIGGQVVFETVRSTPEGTPPNLFFRNAFLEFESAFGKTAPDFADIPEENRFERIAFKVRPKSSAIMRLLKGLITVLRLLLRNRKAMLWAFGLVLVVASIIFSEKSPSVKTSSSTKTMKAFADQCIAAGGQLSGDDETGCLLNGAAYWNWNLPGEKGERRAMILKIGPEKIPCTGLADQSCLDVDGQAFHDRIEGFTFREGEVRLVPIIREQLCDLNIRNDCPEEGAVFHYKQLFDVKNRK